MNSYSEVDANKTKVRNSLNDINHIKIQIPWIKYLYHYFDLWHGQKKWGKLYKIKLHNIFD